MAKRFDFYTLWTRTRQLNKSVAPQGSTTIADVIGLATWPALALFTKYTLDMDIVEHHDREHRVDKRYPHMVQTRGVNYGWGSPCTAIDLECERAYKIKMDAEKAEQ